MENMFLESFPYLSRKSFNENSQDFLDKLYLEYGYVELCDGVVGEGGVGDGFRHWHQPPSLSSRHSDTKYPKSLVLSIFVMRIAI